MLHTKLHNSHNCIVERKSNITERIQRIRETFFAFNISFHFTDLISYFISFNNGKNDNTGNNNNAHQCSILKKQVRRQHVNGVFFIQFSSFYVNADTEIDTKHQPNT